MSTTWVFVGLLCGRELAISTMNKDYKFKYVFPLIGKDFVKMIFGLSVSVAIVLAIHYFIILRIINNQTIFSSGDLHKFF